MSMKYLLTTVIYNEEGKHKVYGIKAINSAGETVRTIPDVFCDKRRAEELVAACNKENVSTVHLDDIIEDALV